MSKRVWWLAGGIVALGLVALLVARSARARVPRYTTVATERGDLQETVGATGTLEAVTTVQVGSQVSGNIMSLGADFNSQVKRGQVVARLEPSTYEARLAQMQANLTAAQAGAERSQATLDDAQSKFARARELLGQGLLPQSDFDTAESTYQGAVAQLKASRAAVKQAEANLSQARVDLAHTIITAPIDGVVVARNVDIGQTVAASFQAPVLFVIANDLTRMQVKASIDESDIGRVHTDLPVSFRVDAYPDRDFSGRVEQVRLQPVTTQNVVTYDTIISALNPDQRLMPGMTATVSVIVASREGVLRVPAAALRFRPEGFVETRPSRAPGSETAPAGGEGRRRGQGGRRAEGGVAAQGRAPGETGTRGRRGLVFVLDAQGQPQPTPVRTGLSDGRFVELLEGPAEGTLVITGEESGAPRPAAAGSAPGSTNPFAPTRPQRRSR